MGEVMNLIFKFKMRKTNDLVSDLVGWHCFVETDIAFLGELNFNFVPGYIDNAVPLHAESVIQYKELFLCLRIVECIFMQ